MFPVIPAKAGISSKKALLLRDSCFRRNDGKWRKPCKNNKKMWQNLCNKKKTV